MADSEREATKRPKLKVIPEGPFTSLVRIVKDILSRGNNRPTREEVAKDLKEFGISTESQWGPSLKKTWNEIKKEERLSVRVKLEATSFERARQLTEAEAMKQKEIAKSTLERIRANRPPESVVGSPMGSDSTGRITHSRRKANSDQEFPIE